MIQIVKKATPRRTTTAIIGEPINCPKEALSEAKIGIPNPEASIIEAEKLYDIFYPLKKLILKIKVKNFISLRLLLIRFIFF
tara:strand:+ start:73 stop:318 length:246 start_codon:yes stop_codon:yes gene_type:complete